MLNQEVIRQSGRRGYIEEEKRRQLTEIERRRRRYLGDRPAVPVEGRTAIIVDDGIATGGTVRAALRGIRRAARAAGAGGAGRAGRHHRRLGRRLRRFVCLATPEPFYAVGAHYRDFTQTEDDEVIRLLAEARNWSRDGIRQP